jgi:hypothetical protein
MNDMKIIAFTLILDHRGHIECESMLSIKGKRTRMNGRAQVHLIVNDTILLCMHVCLSHVKYGHEMWEYNMLNVKITGWERSKISIT